MSLVDDVKELIITSLNLPDLKLSDIDENAPYRIFHFDWFKWYSIFPEVKFMMNFLEEIEEPHFYDFVRLGQDNGDIEQMNNDEYYFNIETNVSLA